MIVPPNHGTRACRRPESEDTRQDVAIAVTQLYKVLGGLLRNPTEISRVKEQLKEQEWIWVGVGFESIAKVALSGPLDLSPWLFVIPEGITPFREMLLKLGVPSSFQAFQFAGVLVRSHLLFTRQILQGEVYLSLLSR